ncbi:MAG: hypothetical protein E6G19_02825 [Actinobacteria bacterium]|nr:MAG: hypothetical protein E6G19_02825 [Actinomycetota bacterium]
MRVPEWGFRTWVFIAWTLLMAGVVIVARFTFARPVSSSGCPPNDDSGLCFNYNLRPLWYFLLVAIWLVGLGLIALIGRRREPERNCPGCRRWVVGGAAHCPYCAESFG